MTDQISEMPRRKGISRAERRRLTLLTTLASLGRNGAEGTSLRSVCRDMQVSPALLTHTFAGWHEILVTAYDLLADRFLARLTPLLSQEFPSERARMLQMMTAYMAADWGGENTVGTMLAFWQLSRTVAELKEPFSRFLEHRQKLMHYGMAKLAAECGAKLDPDELTLSLILMMDGVWLHLSLNPGWITRQAALDLCWRWITGQLDIRLEPAPSLA